MGLAVSSFLAVRLAFSRTVLSMKSPGLPRIAIAAGTIAFTMGPIEPGNLAPLVTTSQAAATAPQRSCPSTTTRGAPRCSAPYSTVPMVAVSTMLPALRATNSWPTPRPPNSSSGATRLSAQPTTTAQGAWPPAPSARCLARSSAHT